MADTGVKYPATVSTIQESGDDNDWVVNHVDGNNEIHIFSGLLSRDTVRSRYTTLNNVKIQNTRAKRWSNKKKELAN